MDILTEGQYFGKRLQSGSDDIFKVSLTHYREDTVIDNHYHTNNYLSVLTNGSYIEKNDRTASRINAGDILFRPRCYSHQNVFNSTKGVCFNIEFTDGWERKLGVKLKLPERFGKYKPASMPMLYKAIINFKNNMHVDLTSEYVLDWLYSFNERTVPCSQLPCVKKASDILDNELGHYHSLKQIAERLHIHPVYFSRAFKERIDHWRVSAKIQTGEHGSAAFELL